LTGNQGSRRSSEKDGKQRTIPRNLVQKQEDMTVHEQEELAQGLKTLVKINSTFK
jgi:hypothetical protein